MYHGEASFMKIYPRDVSRNFRNGKMSVVVYPKPSLIKFTTSATNMEEIIDANEIEPLIAKDITIRAKKKSNEWFSVLVNNFFSIWDILCGKLYFF